MKKISICAIVWRSHIPLWLRAAKQLDWLDFQVHSSEQLGDDPNKLDAALQAAQRADLVYCYRSTENFWEYVAEQMEAWPHKPPVVCISHDPSLWSLSNVGLEVVSRCHDYFVYGGEANYANMLRYMAATVLGHDVAFDEPEAARDIWGIVSAINATSPSLQMVQNNFTARKWHAAPVNGFPLPAYLVSWQTRSRNKPASPARIAPDKALPLYGLLMPGTCAFVVR